MCEVAVLPTVCIQQHPALLSTLVLCTLPCLMKHICLPLGWRHSHRTTVINLPWNIPTVKSKDKLTVPPPMCLGLLFLESLENEQMSNGISFFPIRALYPCPQTTSQAVFSFFSLFSQTKHCISLWSMTLLHCKELDSTDYTAPTQGFCYFTVWCVKHIQIWE